MALSSTYAIEEDMRVFHQNLQKWTAKQMEGFEDATHKHSSTMNTLNDQTSGLKQEKEVLEGKVQERTEKKDNLVSSSSELRAKLAALQQQLGDMPASLEEVMSAQSSVGQEHKDADMEVMEQEARLQFKQNELGRAVSRFGSRLGMQIGKEKGSIRITFTQVDARDHARAFTFVVGVDPSTRDYVVAECVPAVGGVEAVLARVNAKNDFGLLVQAMRREFQAVCQ